MRQLLLVLVAASLAGCARPQERQGSIQVKGSDTMVNLVQAWAAAYMREHPGTSVAVTGGGSGTGIAALIEGTTDVAACSREMAPEEIRQAQRNGITPVRHAVALDALTVIVNPRNPVSRLSMGQLAAIYTGNITNWRQVGGPGQRIVALARERNSGTHVFFLEHVLRGGNPRGKQEYAPGVLLLPSSQAIADEVAANPQAIGYLGLGYYQPGKQKAIAVARTGAGPFVAPSVQSVHNRSYPLARPLLLYTSAHPRPAAASFVAFVTTPEGERIVQRLDFVPLPR